MWNKPGLEESQPQPVPAPVTEPVTALRTVVAQPQVRQRPVIGPTISIKGDLIGEEDLLIEGCVEGKIEMRHHGVTIGKNGRINADIYGKIITVEGSVEGNLYGAEQLIVRQSGKVRGNIVAPRVTLEDGSNFKGSIDMNPTEKSGSHSEILTFVANNS